MAIAHVADGKVISEITCGNGWDINMDWTSMQEKYMNRQEEDDLIRKLIYDTQVNFTDEQWKQIEDEAPWCQITEDGIKYSKGWREMFSYVHE